MITKKLLNNLNKFQRTESWQKCGSVKWNDIHCSGTGKLSSRIFFAFLTMKKFLDHPKTILKWIFKSKLIRLEKVQDLWAKFWNNVWNCTKRRKFFVHEKVILGRDNFRTFVSFLCTQHIQRKLKCEWMVYLQILNQYFCAPVIPPPTQVTKIFDSLQSAKKIYSIPIHFL